MSVLGIVGIYLSFALGLVAILVYSYKRSVREKRATEAKIDRMNERIATTNLMPEKTYDLQGKRIS